MPSCGGPGVSATRGRTAERSGALNSKVSVDQNGIALALTSEFEVAGQVASPGPIRGTTLTIGSYGTRKSVEFEPDCHFHFAWADCNLHRLQAVAG
jgi:hypothetical protein